MPVPLAGNWNANAIVADIEDDIATLTGEMNVSTRLAWPCLTALETAS